jgi:hypothetical protein
MNADSYEPLLKIQELAQRLRIDRHGVRKLVKRRAIPVIKLNSRVLRFRWSRSGSGPCQAHGQSNVKSPAPYLTQND